MPAQLLLVNPSAPRRRNPSKAPTAAQKAARAKFAAMARAGKFGAARKNPGKKRKAGKKSFASTPFGKSILASKARKNPRRMSAADRQAAASLAADTGSWTPKEKTVATKKPRKARKSKARKSKAAAPAAPKKRRRRAKKASAAAAPKRRRTAKKAIAKRSKRAAAPKATRRRRRRSAKRALPAAYLRLRKKSRSLRKRAKSKKGVSRSILSLRARAAGLKARTKLKTRKSKRTGKYVGLSPAQRKALKASGLMKVNPSFGGIIKDLGVLLPQAGATVAGLAGAAILSSKATKFLREKMPGNTMLQSVHVPAVLSVLMGVLGYVGARMLGSKPGPVATFVNKLAPSLFIGGVGAAAVHTLSAVKGADGISMGAKLGLPIGDYVVGDYVVGGNVIDVDGTMVHVDGMGSVFRNRTLGDYVPYEVSADGPREGGRGRRLETSAASIVRDELDAYDGKLPVDGNLSGSIFED